MSQFQLAYFLWCKQRFLASVVVDQHVRPVLVAFSPELQSFIFPSYKQPYCFVWMHIWPWRHCILNTRKSIYVGWPIYVVHSSWNALQESGEQFGIHQAKNVVFFQIQVAFSALRHGVSDNRRGFFLATDPANGTELLLFLAVQQDVSANTSAFCFTGIAKQLWGFRSHVMLLNMSPLK